jgi:hypothetical protein
MSDRSRGTEAQRGAHIEGSLFFLMTRFGVSPCAWIAEAIKYQIEMLLRQLGDADAAKARLYRQLLPAWRQLAAETDPTPEDMTVASAAISIRSTASPPRPSTPREATVASVAIPLGYGP